jgi:hypothetical protein
MRRFVGDRLLTEIDWPVEQTEAAQGGEDASKHLWEESWDDDDTNDDFSTQLKCVPPRCRNPMPCFEMGCERAALPAASGTRAAQDVGMIVMPPPSSNSSKRCKSPHLDKKT